MRSKIYTRTFVRLLYPYHGSLDFLAPEYIALDSHVYLDTVRRGIIIHFVALASTGRSKEYKRHRMLAAGREDLSQKQRAWHLH